MNFQYWNPTAVEHAGFPEGNNVASNKPECRVPHIFLAAVDFELRSLLQRTLAQAGYHVTSHTPATDLPAAFTPTPSAIQNPTRESYDLLILDAELLKDQDVRRMQNLQQREILPPVILITAFSNQQTRVRMRALKTVAQFDRSRASSAYHQLASVLRVVPL